MDYITGLTLVSLIILACSGFVDIVHNDDCVHHAIYVLFVLCICTGFARFILS